MKTKHRPILQFTKRNVSDEAASTLAHLRSGGSQAISCLEVIDEILRQASPDDKLNFDLLSGGHQMSWDMAERLRFYRGLDVRR